MRPELPHETQEVELIRDRNGSMLRDLHQLLDPIVGKPGWEHVYVLADFRGGENFKPADMFVNEMGHQLGLPHNKAATQIYRRNAIMNQGATPEELANIVGPAVLFEKRVWR
jgi:hypothetical protein